MANNEYILESTIALSDSLNHHVADGEILRISRIRHVVARPHFPFDITKVLY